MEAQRFLETVKATGDAQTTAFYFLALDSGARKSELFGILWTDLDLDAMTLLIERQLDRAGAVPVFGQTKTKKPRSLGLGAETVAALRVHRRQQLELRLKNGAHYVDFGLVFAKEPVDVQRPGDALGQPIQTFAGGRFAKLLTLAGVKRIKFHGLRHSCATLLLSSGVPPHVVAARLGHSIGILMSTYAHALPNMQQDAADRLGRLLHAGGSGYRQR